MPTDQTSGQIDTSLNTMRNKQCWVLSFLVIGIITFPQIIADSDDDVIGDIVDDISSEVNDDDCLERFYNMIVNVTDESRNENADEIAEMINKLSQDFLVCIFADKHDTGEPEQVPDTTEDEEIFDDQNPYELRSVEPIRSNTFKPRNKATNLRQAIAMIEDFQNLPNRNEITDYILVKTRHLIKEFVTAGLFPKYEQKHTAKLFYQLLYIVYHKSLTMYLGKEVQAIMHELFEPYKKEWVKFVRSEHSMFSELSEGSKMNKMRNGQRIASSECHSKKPRAMMGCVHDYVINLVKMEASGFFEREEDKKAWRSFGIKLLYELQNLSIMILEVVDSSRELLTSDRNSMQTIYAARSKIITCANMLRDKHRGTDIGEETISECLNSTTKLARGVVDSLIVNASLGDIDTSDIITLEENVIRENLLNLLSIFPTIREMDAVLRRQIEKGLLVSNDNPKHSFAWGIVREWNESSIKDVDLRFVTMFGNGLLTNIDCPLNEPDTLRITFFITDSCWKSFLDDLAIIESVIFCQNGLSLQTVFYGHPILMNYIYVVENLLPYFVRPCPPDRGDAARSLSNSDAPKSRQ